MKITTRQRKILTALAEEGAVISKFPGGFLWYVLQWAKGRSEVKYREIALKVQSSTVSSLYSAGLIQEKVGGSYIISVEGRRVLEAPVEKPHRLTKRQKHILECLSRDRTWLAHPGGTQTLEVRQSHESGRRRSQTLAILRVSTLMKLRQEGWLDGRELTEKAKIFLAGREKK